MILRLRGVSQTAKTISENQKTALTKAVFCRLLLANVVRKLLLGKSQEKFPKDLLSPFPIYPYVHGFLLLPFGSVKNKTSAKTL